MTMKCIALFALLLFVLPAIAQPQQKTEQIKIDGISRHFVTYIPSITDTGYKMPVLISLHGRLGTGQHMMTFADFRPIAEKENFIIVCPDGIDRSWNDGRPTPAEKKGINDVKFIDELITYIVKTYHGDVNRVYVTGMSNGGFMTSRLACELNNKIAAIAIVAASMDKGMTYQPQHAMPVMYIQGTSDPLVPFEGGTMKGAGGEIYSHKEIIQKWAAVNGCNEKPIITNLPDSAHDGTTIIKEVYCGPKDLPVVIGYTVVDGGHIWPGGSQYLPKFIIGKNSNNLNACRVILGFFKSFKRVDAVDYGLAK
jgi:polyhydroxybutyrate depolymerase